MKPALYGYAAVFENPQALLQAARKTQAEGYRNVRAYSPFPVEGLAEAVGFRHNWLPLVVLCGGALGGGGGYFMQWYACVVSYRLNVGGRPLDSWPSFVPVTFELTVLGAALTAFLSVFVLSGLPRLHHPIGNTPGFERSTRDRFFLSIEARDPLFHTPDTWRFLHQLGAVEVVEVYE